MSENPSKSRSSTPSPTSNDAAERQTPDEALEKRGAPRKEDGDALLDGSGTRHGVREANERPGK